MNSFDCVFVLNLHAREDRMDTIADILYSMNIKFERFEAIHKDTLHGLHACFLEKNPNSTLTTPGYLACLLSHLSIYRLALDRGYTSILVLEDDALIHKNANVLITNFRKNVPLNWDFLHFGYLPLSKDLSMWSHEKQHFSFVYDDDNVKIVRSEGFWATHAYAIGKNMMKYMIQYANENELLELDRLLVVFQERKDFNFYGAYPPIFGQRGSASDLTANFETSSQEQKFINLHLTPRSDFL